MVELAPFDVATSAAHLRRHRPDASGAEAAEFHDRTGGNPRAQFYALDQAANDTGWTCPGYWRSARGPLSRCSRTCCSQPCASAALTPAGNGGSP